MDREVTRIKDLKKEELEEKVLELRKRDCPGYEIATTLHIEQRKVTRIINSLINQGLLNEEDRSLKKKGTLQRKQKTLELINDGKTIKEIANILDISLDTVYVYIKQFIEEGKISKDDLKRNVDLDLENKVLELREKRYSKMQIMQELGIGKNAVVDIIQRLADEGKITSTRLIKEPEKIIRKNQSRDDIQELFSSEYTIVEVAKILRTSISNVFDYVYELISEGKLDKNVIVLKRKASLTEVEQRIIALLEQGKNRQVISEELQLSYNEINPIISRLIKEKRVSPIRKNNKEKDLVDETKYTVSNDKIIYDSRVIKNGKKLVVKYMARKSKKAREMDEIKEKIKSSLIKQLRAKGAETAHFLDIIDDYMEFYDTKKALQEDIKERGVSYKTLSANGFEITKQNQSVKDMVAVEKQMLSILKELGLTTDEPTGNEVIDEDL